MRPLEVFSACRLILKKTPVLLYVEPRGPTQLLRRSRCPHSVLSGERRSVETWVGLFHSPRVIAHVFLVTLGITLAA